MNWSASFIISIFRLGCCPCPIQSSWQNELISVINLALQLMSQRGVIKQIFLVYLATHVSHILRSPHDDVIKWKHFPRNWTFVRGIHRSPVNSPHKGQWRGALMFSLICVWINGWVNNHRAGDLRRHRGHYDVIVMIKIFPVYLATHASHILHSPFISSECQTNTALQRPKYQLVSIANKICIGRYLHWSS